MTRPRIADADVVVLTAIPVEYAAVRTYLTDPRPHIDANGTRYETGRIRGGQCRIALALITPGNLGAAALTGRTIEEFRPMALLLVGVAGGLGKEVELGDVVVATRIHAYQGGRAETAGFRPRPKGWPLSHGLEQHAKAMVQTKTWIRLPPHATGPPPAVHFKPIASGDVVLDSRRSPIATLIGEHYSDAIAVDMESAGVAEAAHRHDFHYTVTIRGVSDFADGSKKDTDAVGWQQRAAANAAAFAAAFAEEITSGPVGIRPARPVRPGPYRGLSAFREQDADWFFGREQLAGELAELVAHRRFVLVAGQSGSGKSSLVNAGLIPRLRGRGWTIAAPGPMPGVLQSGEPWAQPNEVLGAAGPNVLVCVDQFEELAIRSEQAAGELARLLTELATRHPRVHVVLTMRTDLLDFAVNRLGLGELARSSVFLVSPMSAEQLRAAIVSPAEQAGASFERGLAERIVTAAQGAPAALTLTQFALTRLWDQQDRWGNLTNSAYDGFGGVSGALASYAEHVWTRELDDAERIQARRLLVQLVRPHGEEIIRRTAHGNELVPSLVPLARRLATTRLVVIGSDDTGEITFELAHAALAEHWQRLRDWLREDRDFRTWQEDLRENIQRAEPLHGTRLTDALRWLRTHPHDISGDERDFITTSRRRHRSRTAAWRTALALIVVLGVVAGIVAVNLQQRSTELQQQLRQNATHALLTQARERLSSEPDTAALLTAAAHRADASPPALTSLAGEYLRYRSTSMLIDPGVADILDVAVSADRRTIAVAGPDGAAVIRTDQQPIKPERRGQDLRRIALAADGRSLAGSTDRGRVEVWQPDGTVTVLQHAGQQYGRASALSFDARGRRLLAVLPHAGLVVWDLERNIRLPVPAGASAEVELLWSSVRFGPDGDSVVVAALGKITVWRLAANAPAQPVPVLDQSTATVSGDGRTAVTCSETTLVSWDLTTFRERRRRPIPPNTCPKVNGEAIDYAGRTVLTATPQESDTHPRAVVSLVDMEAGVTARPVMPSAGALAINGPKTLARSPEGARLVTAIGKAVAVVDVAATDFAPVNGEYVPDGPSPLLSADQRFAVTTPTQPQRMLRLWDMATGTELASTHNSEGLKVQRFSTDGRRLLATDQALTHLVILDVPSLRVISRVRLPVAPNGPGPLERLCIADTASPDLVAVLVGGLISRFSLTTGTQSGDSLPESLAGTAYCDTRRGSDEIAFDMGTSAKVLDLNRGTHVALLVSGEGPIAGVRFSPDGQLLAVLGFDGQLEIWDVESRQPVGNPLQVVPPSLAVRIVAFPSPDRILIGGVELIRIWDLNRRAAIADVETKPGGSHAVVAPDGSTLMFWSLGGVTRMPLDVQHWIIHLCRVAGRDLTAAERQNLPPGSPTEKICPG